MWKDWLPEKMPIPGMETVLVALVVVLVLSFAARYLTRLAERLTRPFPFSHELLTRVAAPLHLLIPLFGLQAVWGSAPGDLVFIKGARQLTSLAMIGAFTWLGLRAVDAVQQIILLHHPVDVADNRDARRIQTQTRVLVRTLSFVVLLFGAASMLMTIPAARRHR